MEVRKYAIIATLVAIAAILVYQQITISRLLNRQSAEQIVIVQPTVNLPPITRISELQGIFPTYTLQPTYTPYPTYTPSIQLQSTPTPQYIYSTMTIPTLAPQRPLGRIEMQGELTSTSEIWLTTKQVLIDFGIWPIMQSGIAIFFVVAIVMILLKFFRA
jgi:hypothetical protein